jgi:hypothetical protein
MTYDWRLAAALDGERRAGLITGVLLALVAVALALTIGRKLRQMDDDAAAVAAQPPRSPCSPCMEQRRRQRLQLAVTDQAAAETVTTEAAA